MASILKQPWKLGILWEIVIQREKRTFPVIIQGTGKVWNQTQFKPF